MVVEVDRPAVLRGELLDLRPICSFVAQLVIDAYCVSEHPVWPAGGAGIASDTSCEVTPILYCARPLGRPVPEPLPSVYCEVTLNEFVSLPLSAATSLRNCTICCS